MLSLSAGLNSLTSISFLWSLAGTTDWQLKFCVMWCMLPNSKWSLPFRTQKQVTNGTETQGRHFRVFRVLIPHDQGSSAPCYIAKQSKSISKNISPIRTGNQVEIRRWNLIEPIQIFSHGGRGRIQIKKLKMPILKVVRQLRVLETFRDTLMLL